MRGRPANITEDQLRLTINKVLAGNTRGKYSLPRGHKRVRNQELTSMGLRKIKFEGLKAEISEKYFVETVANLKYPYKLPKSVEMEVVAKDNHVEAVTFKFPAGFYKGTESVHAKTETVAEEAVAS